MKEYGALVEWYRQRKRKYYKETLSQCHYVDHKSHKDCSGDQTRASAVKWRLLTVLSHGTAEIVCIKHKDIKQHGQRPPFRTTPLYRRVKASQITMPNALLNSGLVDRAGQVVAQLGGKLWRAARQVDPPSLAHPRILQTRCNNAGLWTNAACEGLITWEMGPVLQFP